MSRLTFLFCIGFLVSSTFSARISDNKIEKIQNNEELISSIVSECFGPINTMACLKEKVLTYLDTTLGLKEEESRSLDAETMDEIIYNRVARILATNEFKIQLPETIFEGIILKYNPQQGLNIETQEVEGNIKSFQIFSRRFLTKHIIFNI